MEKNQSRFLRRNTEINTVMKRILSGLGCWLAIGISLYGVENLPLLMQRGKYGQVKSLVEAGDADLEATDSFNRTVLHWAALDNAELIPLLLKKGSDIEAMDGNSVELSLDLGAQRIVEKWVTAFKESTGAKNIGVIVENPSKGKPTSEQQINRKIRFCTLPAVEKPQNRKSSLCC